MRSQCSVGGGDPTTSIVVLLDKIGLSACVALLALALLSILIKIQPSARKFNAFADNARKQKDFKWHIVFLLFLYYIIIPAMPLCLVLFLLNHPELFVPGFLEEAACSFAGWLLYVVIANAPLPMISARMVLNGENFLDMPRGT
jgi:hypothetical protein